MGKGRDDVGLGPISNCRGQWLAGQHMRTVKLPVDDTVQQNFPVCLRLKRHKQTFVFEIAVLIRDRERCHIRQLDEPEPKLVFFEIQHLGHRGAGAQGSRGDQRFESVHSVRSLLFSETQKAARLTHAGGSACTIERLCS